MLKRKSFFAVLVEDKGVGSPFYGEDVVIFLRAGYLHLMGLLCAYGVVVGCGVNRRGASVGVYANLFHDVDFAAVGPSAVHAHGHHPVGRPCAFAFGENHAGLEIAVGPAHIVLGVDAAGVNLAVGTLEASNHEVAVLDFGDALAVGAAVDIVLKFVVDPAGVALRGAIPTRVVCLR